jgi:hypothetical protein
MLNSRRFVLPYNSTFNSATGLHSFHYWSLHDRFTLQSPFEFRAGDVAQLASVDLLQRVVNLVPVSDSEPCSSNLVFVSNDIPMDADEKYELEYAYCTPLLIHETTHHGNKIYTLLLITESEHAYVRGHNLGSYKTRQRFSFVINSRVNG